MPPPHQLYLGTDRFLYGADALCSGLTARASAALLVSCDGRPFELHTAGGERLRTSAAFVAPHAARALRCEDSGFVSLNLEPGSLDFRRLRHRFGDCPMVDLPSRAFAPLRERVGAAVQGQLDDGEALDLGQALVGVACDSGGTPPVDGIDPRALSVMMRLRASPRAPTLQALAAGAGLSPGRLTHLFSRETGVSVKHYALWAKMRRGAHALLEGLPLTEVAHRVGFADSAHMSRTFGRLFGLPPSFLADRGQVALHCPRGGLADWATVDAAVA